MFGLVLVMVASPVAEAMTGESPYLAKRSNNLHVIRTLLRGCQFFFHERFKYAEKASAVGRLEKFLTLRDNTCMKLLDAVLEVGNRHATACELLRSYGTEHTTGTSEKDGGVVSVRFRLHKLEFLCTDHYGSKWAG